MAHRGQQAGGYRALSLVDWMFLLGHDDRSGRPRLAREVLGVGLAGAALLQLAVSNAIYVKPTGEVVRYTDRSQLDQAADYVLHQIVKGEPRTFPAFDWINVLRDDLYAGVGQTLAKDGVVTIGKAALGGKARYLASQPSLATQPISWVYGMLRTQNAGYGEVPQHQRLIAALTATIGVATAVTALPSTEIEANLPAVLDLCPPECVLIIQAAGQVKRKLAMTVRR